MIMKKDLRILYENVKSPDIKIEKNCIIYKGQKFSEDKWLSKICSFKEVSTNDLVLQKTSINELPSTILIFFRRNVSKISKLGLIFPCIIFLVFSLISLTLQITLQTGANFDFFKKMTLFIGIVYFLLSFGLLIKIVKGDKAFITTVRGQIRYKFINKKTYNFIVEKLIEKSSTEYYYFKNIKNIFEERKFQIREFKYEDVNDLFEVFKNKNVFKFLLSDEFETLNNSIDFVNKCIIDYKEKRVFKLAIQVENKVIGYIGLSKMDLTADTCQIIYAIGEEYWGNGYVSKAIFMFIPWLKQQGKKLIIAGHVMENVNSGKVLIKSGFERYIEKDYVLNIHGEAKNIISYKYIDEK